MGSLFLACSLNQSIFVDSQCFAQNERLDKLVKDTSIKGQLVYYSELTRYYFGRDIEEALVAAQRVRATNDVSDGAWSATWKTRFFDGKGYSYFAQSLSTRPIQRHRYGN